MSNVLKTVICQDIEGKEYTVNVSDLRFRPAVYGVIIQDGKILLSKQWDGYDFPGGGIELGEDNNKALVREVKEETGLEVEVGDTVYCSNSFFKLPFVGDFVHSIHMYYECQVVGGKLSTDFFDEHEKEYASQAEWIDLNQIGRIKVYSSCDEKMVLKKFLSKSSI